MFVQAGTVLETRTAFFTLERLRVRMFKHVDFQVVASLETLVAFVTLERFRILVRQKVPF